MTRRSQLGLERRRQWATPPPPPPPSFTILLPPALNIADTADTTSDGVTAAFALDQFARYRISSSPSNSGTPLPWIDPEEARRLFEARMTVTQLGTNRQSGQFDLWQSLDRPNVISWIFFRQPAEVGSDTSIMRLDLRLAGRTEIVASCDFTATLEIVPA